jgi:hypothetical protein
LTYAIIRYTIKTDFREREANMPDEKTVVLLKRWTTGKEMLDSLKKELADIENELLDMVGVNPYGSKTTRLEGYKVTVKCPINRTIDGDKWEEVKGRIPSEMWPVRLKLEPDAKGCTWLAENRPDLWGIAAQAITEKPGKPGFTIEKEPTDE